MTGKLFLKRLLLTLVVVVGVSSYTNAQTSTTTITTTYASNNLVVTWPPTGSNQPISFQVTNNLPNPISVYEVLNYHIARRVFVVINTPPVPNDTFVLSNNDALYEVYYSSTSLIGPSVISTATGWEKAGEGSINTATEGITPVVKDMDVLIPSGQSYRFALVLHDTLAYGATLLGAAPNQWLQPLTPRSFTSNFVTLTAVDSNQFRGLNYNLNRNNDSMGFRGGISFLQVFPPVLTSVTRNVCLDGTIRITASAQPYYKNPTYTWYRDGVQIQQSKSNTVEIQNATFADGGVYCVEVQGDSSNYISEQACARVKIIDPKPPAVVGKFDYCLNERYEPVTVLGTNPKWYYVDTLGSPLPVLPSINTSTPNVQFYYVSQTDQFGCESTERTRVRLSAAPKPEPPIVSSPIYYCENTTPETLTAVGDTLNWYFDATGGFPSKEAPTPNTSVRDSFDYFVTQTIDGCESDRSRIDVVVTFRPNGQILVDKYNICANDSIEIGYYGSAFPGAAYNWTLPDGSVRLDDTIGAGPYKVQLTEAGSHEIKLRVGASGCLSELYYQEVGVKPIPGGSILAKDDVCLGQDDLIMMGTYDETIDTFDWDFDEGITAHFATDQGPYGVYWQTPGIKNIKVTLYDEGCVAEVEDSVIVHDKPNATITAELIGVDGVGNTIITPFSNGDSICSSDSLKISVESVDASARYTWTPTRFFDTYSDLPVTYARVDFSSPIYLDVVDEFGCINKDTILVRTKSCCQITFPNAFTPNQDGKNDLFRPIAVGNRQVESFRVFNRYGQVVYETPAIYRGWDGSFNGKPADLGTYFYMINFECEGETKTQKGEFILLR